MKNTNNYIKNRENPFQCMSPEAKYWIGYIFADGHLVYTNRQYSISLFSKDHQILRKFQSFIGNSAKLYVRPSGIGQVVYYSKPVTEWFMNTFSIPQKKALVLDPTVELDWDILHGYFDGDGSVRGTLHKGRWNRYEAKFTTGSSKWADRISEFLRQEGVPCTIKRKGKAYDVIVQGKANLFYLQTKMYSSNTSRLEYKYQRFVALFGDK